ncbi:DEAD/DEAH box helicase family protein [Azospirillum himalayense]|uniref:DEAD/DEAH box helicase family protein n=1 Tax=Azospirillum himalayense TaxID=654847 RepID=A0ABW0G7T0_9PROT
MSSIELLPFQARAAQQIVNRFHKLLTDPMRPMVHKNWEVPFYQALSAITGAGKTAMLADAVSQIRATLPVQPIVLWISKAKVVVDQTYANFEPGGKYSHLIDPSFTVKYLSELTPEAIGDGNTPFLVLTTVGAFNQKGKSDGTLRVHQVKQDNGNISLWSALAKRKAGSGERRPLIVVYDEGHNLADQQVDFLFELEPDAILVASATLKTPGKLGKMIDRLKDHGWSDKPLDDTKEETFACLVTAVRSKAVVDLGLVKRQIVLGGYTSIMETMIDDMMQTIGVASQKAKDLQAGFEPKAIYVCLTNKSQDDGSMDLPSKPFEQRKAAPILIWRYLVDQKKVDPESIAVYCDLKFDRSENPPPPDFKLFSGGDQDFAAFTAGNYKHIIFNQSLQEGWDDPAVCCAYIDKSMGSAIEVEQVIGRVLRQPGAKHFPDPDLNTASFFIRVDNKQEFPKILKAVQKNLGSEMPEVKIEGYVDPKDRQRAHQAPKKKKFIPEIHTDASDAVGPLNQAVADLHDYTNDTKHTVGKGAIQQAGMEIAGGGKADVIELDTPHSNRVMARWIMRREMLSLYPDVAKAIDWSDRRFDARIEITSPAAAALRREAESIVDIYLDNSELMFEEENLYTVGAVHVNPHKAQHFDNALHDAYDLNPLELEVAEAIDATGLDWARNPVNGGYSIPLLHKGDSRHFFPDFLVWKDDLVFAIDPKGAHILLKDAGVKLLNIRDERGQRKVLVRLLARGRWNEQVQCLNEKDGFTVFSVTKSTSKLKAQHVATVAKAVEAALKA